MTPFVIIVPDNVVVINREFHRVVCSDLVGIHAVYWNGQSGHVEYSMVNGSKRPPSILTDASMFQPEVDAWWVAKRATEEKMRVNI